LKLDLSKNGLNALYLPWQQTLLRHLTTPPYPEQNSRDLAEYLESQGQGRSQANIVIYLNGLYDEGLVERAEARGPGGKTYLYRAKGNLLELLTLIHGKYLYWYNGFFKEVCPGEPYEKGIVNHGLKGSVIE